jgi:NADH-quinone oxidoreductase subunit J
MIPAGILESVLFYGLSAVAIIAAVLMLVQRNPVFSAMYLILNFFCLAGIYLTLSAQFIAVIQILVYAGAIMVLFVFVIMLLNLGDDTRIVEKFSYRNVLAIVLSFGLLLEVFYIFRRSGFSMPPANRDTAVAIGTVKAIGLQLYSSMLFAFEITAFLLLAAIVGALILAKKRID